MKNEDSKDIYYKNFIKDFNLLCMGVSLLNDQVKKNDTNEISIEMKKNLSSIQFSCDYLSKTYDKSNSDNKEKAKKSDLYMANQKIRELESKLGEKVSIADITYAIDNIKKSIEKSFREVGVYLSADISISSVNLNIKLKYISKNKRKTEYATSEEEIKEINQLNIEEDKKFKDVFEFNDIDINKKELILFTEHNIRTIIELVNKNGLNAEIKNISSADFSHDLSFLGDIELYQSFHNFQFPKMYHGDQE